MLHLLDDRPALGVLVSDGPYLIQVMTAASRTLQEMSWQVVRSWATREFMRGAMRLEQLHVFPLVVPRPSTALHTTLLVII